VILRPAFWTLIALVLLYLPIVLPWLIESRPVYLTWLWLMGQ